MTRAAAEIIEDIQKHGPRHRGRKEYIKLLRGEHTTQRERIIAMCYYCMNYYADGAMDCRNTTCPLYIHMPYRKLPLNVAPHTVTANRDTGSMNHTGDGDRCDGDDRAGGDT